LDSISILLISAGNQLPAFLCQEIYFGQLYTVFALMAESLRKSSLRGLELTVCSDALLLLSAACNSVLLRGGSSMNGF